MRGTWIHRLMTLIVVAALSAVPAAATAQPAQADKQPTAIGRGGAAATVDLLATSAAVEALRDGANAIDAAVVAAAVLGVTEPFSCGIGGGGFMVIRTSEGKVTTIDHRERAPAAMRPDSFFEAGQPLAFNDARQRAVGRRAGDGPRLGGGAAPQRHDVDDGGARAGDPGGARQVRR